MTTIGPECEKCGCADTEVIREPNPDSWFASGQAQCNHCNRMFYFKGEEKKNGEEEKKPINLQGDAVIYRPVRCPACNSKDISVTSTVKPVRYHKCNSCHKNFKSVEK